ncbi:hypothetical protein SKAU_G00287200 [Synaphobranchus kaupii]|uniref:STAR protein homodimerisation region domain-containing protein n=1 Tax=Synaphobranchus kaupii TaxID=118154 RepID=A0A9Q1INL0_SYNKA|nr:hypothetical protein SKAU_G00287200 [Synaphobranchus kaupii]
MMVGEIEVKERPRPSPDYLMQLLNEKKLMTSLPNLCGIFTHLERLLDEGKRSMLGLKRGRGNNVLRSGLDGMAAVCEEPIVLVALLSCGLRQQLDKHVWLAVR